MPTEENQSNNSFDPTRWATEHIKQITNVSRNIKNEGLYFAIVIILILSSNSCMAYWLVKDTRGLIIYFIFITVVLVVVCISFYIYYKDTNEDYLENVERKAKKIRGEELDE